MESTLLSICIISVILLGVALIVLLADTVKDIKQDGTKRRPFR